MHSKQASQRRKVQLDYVDRGAQPSRRTIWPLGLFYWGLTWTVGGWCGLREGFRNFRLDRIAQTPVLETRLRADGRPDLARLVRVLSRQHAQIAAVAHGRRWETAAGVNHRDENIVCTPPVSIPRRMVLTARPSL